VPAISLLRRLTLPQVGWGENGTCDRLHRPPHRMSRKPVYILAEVMQPPELRGQGRKRGPKRDRTEKAGSDAGHGQPADEAGMDEKTARRYRRLGRLPSEAAPHRSSAKHDAGNRRRAMAGHPVHAWAILAWLKNGHPVVKGGKNVINQRVSPAAEVGVLDLPGKHGGKRIKDRVAGPQAPKCHPGRLRRNLTL
jgi:hypothetical protein